jgi:hypothetical protein
MLWRRRFRIRGRFTGIVAVNHMFIGKIIPGSADQQRHHFGRCLLPGLGDRQQVDQPGAEGNIPDIEQDVEEKAGRVRLAVAKSVFAVQRIADYHGHADRNGVGQPGALLQDNGDKRKKRDFGHRCRYAGYAKEKEAPQVELLAKPGQQPAKNQMFMFHKTIPPDRK